VGRAALVLLGLLPVPAIGTAADAPPSPWTADDILLAESAGSFQVSPDGAHAVWVKSRMDGETNGRIANLVLTGLAEAREVELTRGSDRNLSPRFSPDGARIAFLSSRALPGKKEAEEDGRGPQIWLIDPRGGEPWPLTREARGIAGFAWRDKGTIVFAAQEAKSLREQRAEKAKDTSQAPDDVAEKPPVRLFSVGVDKGAVSRLTENDDWIQWLAVSPDGRWAVTSHERSLSFPFDHKVPPVLALVDLQTGAVKRLFEGERMLVASAEWTPDSKGFYLVRQHSSHPLYFTATISLLDHFDVASGARTPVALDWANGLGAPQVRATTDGFLALLAEGVRFRPARYTRAGAGWARHDLGGEHVRNLWDWAVSADGRTLVYEHSTPSRPTQWYTAALDADAVRTPRKITSLNAAFESKRLPRAEVIRFEGARGEDVEAILHHPLDFQEGRKYPLLLSIHGGPTGTDFDMWSHSWDYPKVLLAQKGSFLLEVNYHGSGNYGLAWVESICCGVYYDLEREDLEKAVDHVIARGLADPERLGTMGWSNGAILTTELVTRNPRYKVASAGAGDVEWISDWGNVDFGASFDNYYFGKAPYEDPDLYVRKSPFFRLKDVTAPTILYTGTDDRNVPPSQSWSHFRVLQQVGKTPVRLVLFPGEPHGLLKLAHQKRKVEEDLAWFDEHFFRAAVTAEPALKEGSPLETALARARAVRSGGLLGRLVKGKRVPETVTWGALEVGRFEVTRAQYAAFDSGYRFAAGTGDHPASGIPFEKAKAYAAWLAKLTGQPYRLPGADELEPLRASAGAGENTLDAWAGYAPNPDDAERLLHKAEGLGAGALLREAGQSKPEKGGPAVFDLGGNVAEWAIGKDGVGVLAGGSADRPAKATGPSVQAGEAYRGLRVVAGASTERH
jgi:dipeptidyl aminopeptidase/acylaminoacyl peptidase